MKATTVYTEPAYIFLDFDGVLHANDFNVLADPKRPKHKGEYRFAFHQSDLVEFTLKRHIPNARIVVSSTWRTAFNTVEELRCELLGGGCSAGLVNRMVGMTPVFNDGDEELDPSVGTRLQEILAYIRAHELNNVPCLIVDDDCSGFTGKKGLFFPIVIPETEIGFDFKDAENMSRWINILHEEMKPNNWFKPVKIDEVRQSTSDPALQAA